MITYKDELYHHGIKGQKWGVRRYQNADGSLTAAGSRRYNKIEKKYNKQLQKSEKADAKVMALRQKNRDKISSKYDKKLSKIQSDIDSYEPIKNGLKDKKGRDILTANDVSSMTDALRKKAEQLTSQRDAKLKDFDEGTKFVSEGQKAYNDVIRKYRDVKLNSINNYGYNKSPEYRNAVQNYVNQSRYSGLYGTPMTKLKYAQTYAQVYYKQNG